MGESIRTAHPTGQNGTGLPDAEENSALGEIEELIAREVFAATRAVYSLALTTGVIKDVVASRPRYQPTSGGRGAG